jgi:predicted MFS family arabinose efflux permease
VFGGSQATGRSSLRRVLVTLCVTEIASYGVLFYAFTVLLPRIADESGWSQTAVTAAFSAGSLTGGVAGIVVGRVLQRHGPRWVMAGGSALGTVAILGVAWSPSYSVFFAAWVLAGVASAGLFYAPAFATLTAWYGDRRVQAITTLTLAAGFSSTIFAPLTDVLASQLTWRQTYFVLAVVLATITLPLHLVVLNRAWPMAAHHQTRHADRHILTSRTFMLATAAGTLMAFASFASLVNLVPFLTDRGMSSAWAAWALGLGGAGQVAGRLLYPGMTRSLEARSRAILVISGMVAALGGLAVVPGPTLVLVLLAVLAGAARGLFTLVGATLVSDYWGPERYAAISGVFNAPILAASALAPWLGAVIADATGGLTGLFTVLVVVAGAAAVLAACVPRSAGPGATMVPGHAVRPGTG